MLCVTAPHRGRTGRSLLKNAPAHPPRLRRKRTGMGKTPSLLWCAGIRVAGALIALFFFLAFAPTHARAVDFALSADTQRLQVDAVEYLAEPEPLTPLAVSGKKYETQWQRLSGPNFHFGNFHAPVWLRFDLTDRSGTKQDWRMEIGQELLDRIDVHIYSHKTRRWLGPQTAGNLVRLGQWPLKQANFVFPLPLAPGDRYSVYVRVESRLGLFIRLDLWRADAFGQHDYQRALIVGLFFGILIIMVLYNLSLYVLTRDTNYLFYSAYVFTVIFYIASAGGLGARYLWESSLWLREHAYVLFASLSFLSATLFLRYFLSLKSYGGWLLHLNNVFVALWIIAVLLSPLQSYSAYISIVTLLALLCPAAGMITSVYLWFKGNVQAKYYTIAYAFLAVGTTVMLLGFSGVIPRNLFTDYGQMGGFVIELTLLSLALADQINRERAAREIAQKESLELTRQVNQSQLEKLSMQAQIMETQQKSNDELEKRVSERTQELREALKNLEEANTELSNLSITDPLTHTYNRRYFDRILTEELKRASRIHQPLSLAIVDLDNFKYINDNHGHLVGDECLRLVSHTLKQQLRRTGDFIARFGGDEFAIVLPSTYPENALMVADRARVAIESLHFIHGGQRIFLRASIGVAGWTPKQDEEINRLIQAADNALYRAKESGRNCTMA